MGSGERVARWGRAYAQAPTRWVAGVAGVVGLALAAGSVAATGPWDGGQRRAERVRAQAEAHRIHSAQAAQAAHSEKHPEQPSWRQPAPVLAAAGGGSAPSALAATLRSALSLSALGQVTASVVDVSTGRTLYSRQPALAQQPASTNKIATAVAALSLLGAGHRFTTRVEQPAAGRVVLVGGGDPTLSTAGLARLAADTAKALKAAGTTGVRLGYDISAFASPALHPIGVNDNIALVQALTVDEGRIDPHTTENAARYADPAARAAQVFAQKLRAQGVTVTGAPSRATGSGAVLAQLASAPLADVVEEMLTESDNDVAEALGHQIARASGSPATFAAAAAAVQAQLTRLGVHLGSTRLADSSGLSGRDAIPAAVLTQLLALAASPAHPELRPVLTGLPVAGFTGTLGDRYSSDAASAGRGVVRAKTGSLATVNTLAGLVVDRDGRLLAFAFMSNASSAGNARPALDRAAAALASCGCTAP